MKQTPFQEWQSVMEENFPSMCANGEIKVPRFTIPNYVLALACIFSERIEELEKKIKELQK